MRVPYEPPLLTLDEQLADTAERLQQAKAETLEKDALNRTSRLGAIPPRSWNRKPPTAATDVYSMEADPHHKEMTAWLEEINALEKEGVVVPAWKDGVKASLQSLLGQVQMSMDLQDMENQLARVYEWFLSHRMAPNARSERSMTATGQDFVNFCEKEAIESRMPGSAFYDTRDVFEQDDDGDSTAGASVMPHSGGMPGSLPHQAPAQLPSARERLRDFETRQIVTPLVARRLAGTSESPRTSTCPDPSSSSRPQTPKEYRRLLTPSTATGGLTSRSGASSRCTSAVTSRPASALRPSSAIAATPRLQRPSSAMAASRGPSQSDEMCRIPSATQPQRQQRPQTAGAALQRSTQERAPAMQPCLRPAQTPQQAARAQVPTRELTPAEKNMEERWTACRNREVAEQVVEEERHAAVAVWAERRARVEEEISRNAETLRFQSELQQRGYIMSEGASEDVAASNPAAKIEPQGRRRPSSASSGGSQFSRLAAAAAKRPQSALAALGAATSVNDGRPPRYDVSRIESIESRHTFVRFQEMEKPKREHVSDRVAFLRKLHSHLLEAAEDDSDETSTQNPGEPASSIFDTGEAEEYLSLSAYTKGGGHSDADAAAPRREDDVDVLVGACELWRRHPRAGRLEPQESTLDEIRFQQMQEAEAVKRALARRNVPVDAKAVDGGLVMPQHKLRQDLGNGSLFNTEPRLPCGRIKSPKKKKVRRRTGSPGPRRSRAGPPSGPRAHSRH